MTTPTMAEQLVPDEVWAAIQPLLPRVDIVTALLHPACALICARKLQPL